MLAAAVLLLATLFLAYTNGANDNFKGVATLFGSGTTSYRRALWWANATTFAGACLAIVIGRGLVASFSGKGLVPDAIAGGDAFLIAVGLAAGATVLLATRLGLPISTTHAMMGSLVGAGLVAAPQAFAFAALGSMFLLPLLLSPFIAAAIAFTAYPVLSRTRRALGITKSSCLCLAEENPAPASIHASGATLLSSGPSLRSVVPVVGDETTCGERYEGRVMGVSAQRALDTMHYASAGAVCFARGVNDAPKIAALAVATGMLPLPAVVLLVGGAMVTGGALQARRVARTMSLDVTAMNDGQGFTANAGTAALVLAGSWFSLPLSTTHVSCGSLFGLGAATGGAHRRTIARILLSWVATLPIAALIAAGVYAMLAG